MIWLRDEYAWTRMPRRRLPLRYLASMTNYEFLRRFGWWLAHA